MTLMQQFVLSS